MWLGRFGLLILTGRIRAHDAAKASIIRRADPRRRRLLDAGGRIALALVGINNHAKANEVGCGSPTHLVGGGGLGGVRYIGHEGRRRVVPRGATGIQQGAKARQARGLGLGVQTRRRVRLGMGVVESGAGQSWG